MHSVYNLGLLSAANWVIYFLHYTWQIHAGQAVEDDQTHHQEAPRDGAEAMEKGAPDLDSGPKDVEYASIDFSVLNRRNARGAAEKQESTETEYAEIKREEKVKRQDSGGEPDEELEGKQEEAMIAEDEEIKHCVPEEEEAEDAALYSDVKDTMDEIWGLYSLVESLEIKFLLFIRHDGLSVV